MRPCWHDSGSRCVLNISFNQSNNKTGDKLIQTYLANFGQGGSSLEFISLGVQIPCRNTLARHRRSKSSISRSVWDSIIIVFIGLRCLWSITIGLSLVNVTTSFTIAAFERNVIFQFSLLDSHDSIEKLLPLDSFLHL